MFFKKVDLLSPKITLYFNNLSAHKSIFSGILTILYSIVLFIVFAYYAIIILCKTRKMSFYFENYMSDPGVTSLNSTNLFHFLHLAGGAVYDPRAITIIGINKRPSDVLKVKNITLYDHWIYSVCKIKSGLTKEVMAEVDKQESICVQGFYNKSTGQSISITDSQFIYPSINHGTANPDYLPYSIMIRRCENTTGTENCYSDEQIDEYLDNFSSVLFTILDQYIDIDNFQKPFFNYLHSVETGVYRTSVLSTNFHFNPTHIKTSEGFLFSRLKTIVKTTLQETVRGTYEADKVFVSIFQFWIHNRVQVYERQYTTFIDAIASISGISKLASTVFYAISFFYNKFIMYEDFEKLTKKKLVRKKQANDSFLSRSSLQLKTTTPKIIIKLNKDLKVFRKEQVSFKRIIQYYLNLRQKEYMKTLITLRKKIVSEERLTKLYFFMRDYKKVMTCEQKKVMNTSIGGGDYKKYVLEQNYKINSSQDLFVSSFKGHKLYNNS